VEVWPRLVATGRKEIFEIFAAFCANPSYRRKKGPTFYFIPHGLRPYAPPDVSELIAKFSRNAGGWACRGYYPWYA
jgi:hypothetical protein